MRRRGERAIAAPLHPVNPGRQSLYAHTHARGATTISATLARIVHSLPSSHRIRPRGGGDRVSSSLYYLVLPAGSLPPTPPPPPPLFKMQMRHLSSPLSRARFIYHFFPPPPPLPSSIFFFIFFPFVSPASSSSSSSPSCWCAQSIRRRLPVLA